MTETKTRYTTQARDWTQEEIEYLHAHAQYTSIARLARAVHRGSKVVKEKMNELGIRAAKVTANIAVVERTMPVPKCIADAYGWRRNNEY